MWFNKIIKNIKCKYRTYGFEKNNDIYISKYISTIEKTDINLVYKNNTYKFYSKLIGKYNLYNIMASVSACLLLGLDIKQIIKSISSIKQIPGRLEKLKLLNGNFAIVDYAHTPDAYNNILSTISELSSNKKIE